MNQFPQESKSDLSPTTKRRRNPLVGFVASMVVIVGTLFVLSVTAVAILLHSERFHQYVLTTVQQRASETLGVRVELQNFALNIVHLDLDLYGLTVDGAAPYANPPLLQVDHAEVGVRFGSILRGKWYLESFRLDRPIMRVFVDEKGVSNLPTPRSSGKTSSTTTQLFDLAIRRAVLDRGEFYFNSRQTPIAADLHDVAFQASFDVLLQKYSGKLAYANGHLDSGTFKTIPHNLEATFDATPTTFHLTDASLSVGPSHALLTATLQNYSNVTADAHYDLNIDGAQVGHLMNSTSVPTGEIRATGNLHYRQIPNRTPLDSLVVDGDLSSSKLMVTAPSLKTEVSNVLAHYLLENGDANLKDFSLNILGGKVTGAGTMRNIAGDRHSKLNASLKGISLGQLQRLTGASIPSRDVSLTGGLNTEMSATWGANLDDLVAHADTTINGRIQGAGNRSVERIKSPAVPSTGISVEGMIRAGYTASNQQISLNRSYLKTPETSLTMNGVLSERSSLDIRFQADDLREIETIADLFRTPPIGKDLQPLGLAGTASFEGSVRGSTSSPHLAGQLLASNLQFNGTEWKALRTGVELSPSLLTLQRGSLEPSSRGHLSFSASTELSRWSFTNNSLVHLDMDASQLDVADLLKLAGQQVPVTGTLAASVKLHGTLLNPVGNGTLSLGGLVAYDQPVSSAKVTFSGTGDEAKANLDIQLPAGNIQGDMSVRPREKTYIAKLTAAGIRLDRLQVLKARKIDAEGEVTLNGNGHGSFDNPQFDATLQIPHLVVQQQTITAVNLRVNVADHVANALLASSAVNTNIQATAKISLTADFMTDATLDTQAIPLQPLLAIYAPEQSVNLTGETEIHATLHGPLKNSSLLEAHVTIPTLKLAYGTSVQLAATSPVHVDYKNGMVDLQRTNIRGTDTDLQLQGSIPVVGNAPMKVMLLGTVNLELAQVFNPDVKSSGELKFDINSSGGSDVGGKVDIVNAAYASADLPVGLQNGNGTLTLTKDRLEITRFKGTMGGGTLSAQGGVALRPTVQFDLGLAARGIRILYPDGMREGVDADLRLGGSTESAVLGGSINLNDLSFTPAFDLNSFISQVSGGVASPPTPGFSQNVHLNLVVRSSSNINLVSRTLSIDGSANLEVRGTAAKPVILGRVNLNNGDIILNGDRFVLNGGTVEFVNPSETQPVLNLSLKTTIQQYDVYLRFNGPIDQLRTNYNSDPALPSADIINLLAFGHTTEATSTTSPSSLVASQVSSQVTSRVSKIAGISQLSINPVLAGGTSQGPPGANITVQQRVTSNLFVTFSSNVASTQSQTIQGQYQLTPRVALSATRDQNGGFAFDAIIKKTW